MVKSQRRLLLPSSLKNRWVLGLLVVGSVVFAPTEEMTSRSGICGAPPAQGAAAPPHGAAAPPQAAAAQAMAAPAAPGWRERSKINHAKASAWPPGVDFQTVVHPRFLELNTALDQTWHAIKATNKRMKIIREDHDARSRPNTIPELVANAMDHLDDTAAGAFGAIVP
eukprot:GEMP01031016.1.p2 GENE.GEMP01031016.1~~GEMP01031016.1.p2  ORF type:complete len:168 (+),score=47.42 GEMP01031016.1:108-611(+)